MSKINIEIKSEKRAYDGYLKIEEGFLSEIQNGEVISEYSRFAVNRPNAAAVLVYNSDEDKVVLVKQHRYPVHVQGGLNSHILEIPAGKIDGGEDPKEAAIREVKEEIGYDIKEDKIFLMSEFFPSPGYSSEVIYLYAATVKNEDKTSNGGGVEGEHENIEIIHTPAHEFFKMITSGEIIDGKTIVGANAFWHLRNDNLVELGRQYLEILRLEESRKINDTTINEDDTDETSK